MKVLAKLCFVPLLLAGCDSGVPAKDAEKLAVANEVVDSWNKMEWDRAWDTFADDGVLHSMMVDPVVGKAAISERLNVLVAGLNRIELEIVNIGVINDVVVLERVDDFDYKGKQSRVPVVGIMEISDGKVDEWREYYDKATLMEALTVEAEEGTNFAESVAAEEIMALTKQLSIDWNGGDMTAYLNSYRQDNRMALVAGDRVVAGFEDMQQMFTGTWTTETAMGDFETDAVSVQLVAADLAISKGQFEHQFPNETIIGAFSHVWQKNGEGEWKIIHEHTSRKNPE